MTQQVTDALEHYRYADAARTLYDFAWNEFCSFYVEMTKARFAVPEQRQTAQRVLAHALDVLLRLLHPMMPFLTEEVWQLLAQVAPNRGLPSRARPTSRLPRASASRPGPSPTRRARTRRSKQQFADFQAVLGAVREIRQTPEHPAQGRARRSRSAATPRPPSCSSRCSPTSRKWPAPPPPPGARRRRRPDVAASVTLAGQHGPIEVHVDVSRFIDVGAERKRLEKERDNLTKQIDAIDGKLANKAFVDKAPAEVVQQQRDKLAELRGQLASVEAALQKLGIE